MRIPIHREGWPFIAMFAVANFLLWRLWPPAGYLFAPLTLWCFAFFRDPDRSIPQGDDLLISPADGKLLPTIEAPPPPELGLGSEPRRRLSIFMNVFNVHVNRMPLSGTVIARAYRPGRFINASFDKASEHNERMALRVRPAGSTDPDADIAVVQIAGLVARRIVCEVNEGDTVARGTRFGIIRFGSRLDVYLPKHARIVVQDGSVTAAGETVLADLKG